MFDFDSFDIGFTKITKIVGLVAGITTAIGGGVTLSSKFGWFEKENPILTWAPEHFEIYGGPVNGEFRAIVAREKHRDDCAVTGFKLEIRDSEYIVHPATSSVSIFSGPASETIDKFGFEFYFHENHAYKSALGEATLLGEIAYDCPEGTVYVHYPPNLNFIIEEPMTEQEMDAYLKNSEI